LGLSRSSTIHHTYISPNKVITEGSNLSVQCSATGNPLPNVTWVQIEGDTRVIKSTGLGNGTLRIVNITRRQSGTYEGQATNNPIEIPNTKRTEISVSCK
jgi:hypothetical protein